MIFLKKTQTVIWVPRHCNAVGPYRLKITNSISQNEYEFDNLENEGYRSGYWIFMNLDLSKLESGEHEYKLFDKDNNLIENGLIQVMYQLTEPISVSYNNQTNKIVYNG